MPDALIEYQLRIRNAADDADELVVTSVRGGTNPYLSSIPSGDGASFDPLTGVVMAGSFSGRLVDPITSGTSRLLTSILEDAGGRQQLGHRKAFWEFRVDGGDLELLYAGRLTRYSLVIDIEWEVVVGDWMQAEHEHRAFELHPGDSIQDYLDRWPHRGCLVGGPVLGGFLPLGLKDHGGWEFDVAEQGSGSGGDEWTRLDFVKGYDVFGKPFRPTDDRAADMLAAVNQMAHEFFTASPGGWLVETGFGPVPSAFGAWLDLAVIVDGAVIDGVPINSVPDGRHYHQELLNPHLLVRGRWSMLVHGIVETVGDRVRLDVISRAASAVSPIYWLGHPMDLVTEVAEDIGTTVYDATAVTAARTTLGPAMRLLLQVTGPQEAGTLLEETVYGPFGVAARGNATGGITPFVSRILPDTVPSVTISESDVWEEETQAFDLDVSTAKRSVQLSHSRYVVVAPIEGSGKLQADLTNRRSGITRLVLGGRGRVVVIPRQLGGIDEREERYERDIDDAGAIGTGQVSYAIPGELFWTDVQDIAAQRETLAGWVSKRSQEIFDRWGRGIRAMKTHLRRAGAGADVELGDEILVDLPQIPNANKRLLDDAGVAARCMQVVHLTPTIHGKQVTLIDAGPNANAISTRPTLSIAASTSDPRHVAALTITNAATLTAAGYSVRVQVAVTNGSVPAATDYTDFTFYRANEIPTVAFGLPAVYADATVYARARSEVIDERPSNWSDVVNVALDAFDPPSGLTATPSVTDASQCALSWSVGDDSETAAVDVLLRLASESASAARIVETLPPGSTRYTLGGLVASTNYVAAVRHRDESTGELSAIDEEPFTAGATLYQLQAPQSPDGFSYGHRPDTHRFRDRVPNRAGAYGLAVVATELSADDPTDVEIAEAVETGVGSGVYGAYATVGRVPSVQGDWTIWVAIAPSDGKRRKLKARHVRDGATASSYTAEEIITAWEYNPLAPYPGLSVAVSLSLAADDANDEIDATFSATNTPAGLTFELWARDVTLNAEWQLIDAAATSIESFAAFVDAPGGETYDIDAGGGGPDATHEAYVVAKLGGQEIARSPVRSITNPTALGVTIDTVDLAVDDYGLNTLLATFNDNAGTYDHFHVLLKRTGIDSEYTEMPADQTIFDVGALYGWDIEAAGLNTRSLEIRVAAHSAAHVLLGISAEIPQFDFPADDDL